MKLPVIESCEGCGACCREQCSPPGYVMMLAHGTGGYPDPEDIERFKNLPEEVMATIVEHLEKLRSGERGRNGDTPCIWFDKQKRQCRHYEHRPNICRGLEVGSDGCRFWRQEYNVFPY